MSNVDPAIVAAGQRTNLHPLLARRAGRHTGRSSGSKVLGANVGKLVGEVGHLEGGIGQRHVHGGGGHHGKRGHGHGEGGLGRVGGVDGKLDGRRLQGSTIGGEVGTHGHGALGERVGLEASVDVHPAGKLRVHWLHGRGETEAHGRGQRSHGGARGHGIVVGRRGGYGVEAALGLLLLLVLLVLAAIVLLLWLLLVLLRHGAGRDGEGPRLGEGVGLAAGVVVGIKQTVAAKDSAVKVDILVLHDGARRVGG